MHGHHFGTGVAVSTADGEDGADNHGKKSRAACHPSRSAFPASNLAAVWISIRHLRGPYGAPVNGMRGIGRSADVKPACG